VTDPKAARKIILDLIDAGQDNALVPLQDGGDGVEVVFSREPGRETEVMQMDESERRTDEAIRAAWLALTGAEIAPGDDPVDFINWTE
jgi:hypothetical protein